VRFVRHVTRRIVVVAARVAVAGLVTGGLVLGGGVLGGGRALAATRAVPAAPPAAAPLAGSASGTLTQVNAGEWTTTVYLDTAALCAGSNPAGNTFSLVTGKPNSVTGAAAPTYPDGPLACGAAAANPVTQVKLTFTPSLSAVPQAATLTVTPPQALLLAGDPPLQVPLTVRRIVSPWQYVWVPAICGGALAALLVLVLIAIGVPGKDAGQAVPGPHETAPRGQHTQVSDPGRVDLSVRLMLFLMHKRHELLLTEMPVAGGEVGVADGRLADERVAGERVAGARLAGVRLAGGGAAVEARPWAGSDRKVKRVRWGLGFWRTPLFAGAAWSFGDSWATSVTPLTALAGGVLTASGAVAGLVPGVDLTRIGLLMALVGGLTTIAPLLFGALNSLFPERKPGEPAPAGEVTAASLWVMLLASCLTVFAIGAEIGFVGLVLGFNLIVVSPSIRWIGPAVAGLAAILFLAYGAHSILTLVGQPSGTPKKMAHKSSFMI
jgi:hypothetical protein